MFTHKKLAQIAIYLANKVEEKRINYMRLVKLMYLADRESLARYGEPISYDTPYSMPFGLVLSQTLDVIDNETEIGKHDSWNKYFTPRTGKNDFCIGIKAQVGRDELDQLSDSEIDVLDETANKFGKMDEWALSELHHSKQFPEWQDPRGSSIPVDERKLLQSLGIADDEATRLADRIDFERDLNRILRLR